jgi:hypothetical protein
LDDRPNHLLTDLPERNSRAPARLLAPALPANAELVVAIRGTMVYDRVIIGSLLADFNPKSPAAESTLEQAIQ